MVDTNGRASRQELWAGHTRGVGTPFRRLFVGCPAESYEFANKSAVSLETIHGRPLFWRPPVNRALRRCGSSPYAIRSRAQSPLRRVSRGELLMDAGGSRSPPRPRVEFRLSDLKDPRGGPPSSRRQPTSCWLAPRPSPRSPDRALRSPARGHRLTRISRDGTPPWP